MKTFVSPIHRRGFTLIELMVAMAITTIIITILVTVTSISLDTWNRSRSEVRAARQAKSMADSMARDFEAFVSRRGNNFEWLSSQTASNLPGGNLQSSNAAELIFFTAATDRYDGNINTSSDNGGDVSCVSYQLAYQDPINGGSSSGFETFVLYRKLVNPDETFNTLLGKEDLVSAFSSYNSSVTDEENFICENVYQFTVTFHVEVTQTSGTSSQKLTVPVIMGPSSGSGRVDSFRILGTGLQLSGAPSGNVTLDEVQAGRVVAMEVSLTVLSDFAIDQMRRRRFTGNQQQDFLRQHSFQYSKLVEMPGM